MGIERQLRQKSAGMRTHPLVGLGAALFTIVSRYGRPEKDMWRESHFSNQGRRRIYNFLAPEHEGTGRQTNTAPATPTLAGRDWCTLVCRDP
ncbi:MgtC/SapB family protein [Rhodococcus opacus]|nr:MgtC/SapB family protein [Rhodococcus opacus]